MKVLPVSTPTMFIMVGIPGAGKSQFARAFADHYDLPIITIEELAASLPPAAQHITTNTQAASAVANQLAGEFLKTQSSFILDSAHSNNRIERMKLQRMANANRYQTIAVWVQVDEPSARQRSMRQRDSGVSMNERQYMDAVKNFTAPTTERYAVVSGKHTFTTQHNAVLHKLRPQVKKTAPPASPKPESPTSAPKQRPETDEPAAPATQHPSDPSAPPTAPTVPRRHIPVAAKRPVPTRHIKIG